MRNISYRKQKSIVNEEEITSRINKALMVINLHCKFFNLQVRYPRCNLIKMLINITRLSHAKKNEAQTEYWTWNKNYCLRREIKIQINIFITNLSLVQHVWIITKYTMNICPILWKGSANAASDKLLAFAIIVM